MPPPSSVCASRCDQSANRFRNSAACLAPSRSRAPQRHAQVGGCVRRLCAGAGVLASPALEQPRRDERPASGRSSFSYQTGPHRPQPRAVRLYLSFLSGLSEPARPTRTQCSFRKHRLNSRLSFSLFVRAIFLLVWPHARLGPSTAAETLSLPVTA
eukprot:364898-Chlamydomonas_euryale.AAC.9